VRPATTQRGQALVDYAVIIVLAAIVVVAVLVLQGREIGSAFRDVANTLQGP
jgi:Flp pilus assembly pilin Flp